MKPSIITPTTDLCGELIIIASDLTRGIPRELRASLAASIREQCISAMTMLALRAAGSSMAPDGAELHSRLSAILIMVNAAQAKGIIPDRPVRRMTVLIDRIRNDIDATEADSPSPLSVFRPPAHNVEADRALPICTGGQRR